MFGSQGGTKIFCLAKGKNKFCKKILYVKTAEVYHFFHGNSTFSPCPNFQKN